MTQLNGPVLDPTFVGREDKKGSKRKGKTRKVSSLNFSNQAWYFCYMIIKFISPFHKQYILVMSSNQTSSSWNSGQMKILATWPGWLLDNAYRNYLGFQGKIIKIWNFSNYQFDWCHALVIIVPKLTSDIFSKRNNRQ